MLHPPISHCNLWSECTSMFSSCDACCASSSFSSSLAAAIQASAGKPEISHLCRNLGGSTPFSSHCPAPQKKAGYMFFYLPFIIFHNPANQLTAHDYSMIFISESSLWSCNWIKNDLEVNFTRKMTHIQSPVGSGPNLRRLHFEDSLTAPGTFSKL